MATLTPAGKPWKFYWGLALRIWPNVAEGVVSKDYVDAVAGREAAAAETVVER